MRSFPGWRLVVLTLVALAGVYGPRVVWPRPPVFTPAVSMYLVARGAGWGLAAVCALLALVALGDWLGCRAPRDPRE